MAGCALSSLFTFDVVSMRRSTMTIQGSVEALGYLILDLIEKSHWDCHNILNKSITLSLSIYLSMWKWGDIHPSMVTHTRNLCSAFDPPKVHTHTVNTHPEQWAAIYAAAPGEQLWVSLLKGTSVVVLRVEESAVHSLSPPTIPAGPRLATVWLRVWLSNH